MPTNQQHNDWHDCPTGELSQMVGRLNAAQHSLRVRKLYGTAAASMLLIACGVVAVGSVLNLGGTQFGGITCSECKEHFVAYHDFRTQVASMEDPLATNMATHLKRCDRCRSLFQQTYPDVLPTQAIGHQTLPVFAIASFARHY